MKVSESITKLVQELVNSGLGSASKSSTTRCISRAEEKLWNRNYTNVMHFAIEGTPAANIPNCIVLVKDLTDMGNNLGELIMNEVNRSGRSAFVIHEGVYDFPAKFHITEGQAARLNMPNCVVVGDGNVVFKLNSNASLGTDGKITMLKVEGANAYISGITIDANKEGNPAAKVTGIKLGGGAIAENCKFIGCDTEVSS